MRRNNNTYHSFTIRLTTSQNYMLNYLCAKWNCSKAEAIRQALTKNYQEIYINGEKETRVYKRTRGKVHAVRTKKIHELNQECE